MSLRIRLLSLLLAVYCAGGYMLTRRALEQVRPRYLESMEETLVDTSVLLASVLETQLDGGRLEPAGLQRAFASAQHRQFEARVFTLTKTAVDLRVYVTDAAGTVIYDSTGRDIGRDYSRWNDVKRTLRGDYGARSSRTVEGDDNTQSIYVAAPIRDGNQIVGVLSVGKPTTGVNQLVAAARQRVVLTALAGGVVVLLLLLVTAAWVTTPIERLTAYARAVRDGRPVASPKLPGRTLADLARAFEEMRDALEGRQHAERYTQALAHGVKAPLAAIRGAAELLHEDMPAEQRRKFMGNIAVESARIQQIIDRLLELSSLEARKALQRVEELDASALAHEAAQAVEPSFTGAGVQLQVQAAPTPARVRGERVLLREALVNLLQNALDFSPPEGEVTLTLGLAAGAVEFVIEDRGPGVPDYALPRVFERFYSLPRPGTARKSTGLGLALVREVAHLHGGTASLANRADAPGARATLRLPAA
ncbi:two-component system sensor histidine kinase CreC [Opitutus terrae]|uniref:histidine kinase n=1 Tax=Opitutus terrae (strain DSM 11246 / JCM 15787 / PB90-1) TaxID=452637 RepID=B1ZRB4_OPITP|nr:two-component system sensor histidine kinase CreC [Opitutus terrae]ACB74601.1 integral membrane sensor signal transduction histidine kinase [Opitutus terrae PB90-1]